MNAVSEKRLLVVFLVLSTITLASLWLGLREGPAALTPDALVATSAILIALVKTRIVLREFMEVRHAPVVLGRVTDLWLVVTAVCLLVAYFAGLAHRTGMAG